MQANKRFDLGLAIFSAGYIILGILMLVFPDTSEKVICYLLGGISILVGLICIVSYFVGRHEPAASLFRYELAIGVVLLVVGIYLVAWPTSVWAWLPVVLGLCIIFDSIIKLQQSFNLRRAGFRVWWLILLAAIITAVLGVLLVVNAFDGNVLIYYFGIVLIVDGLINLATMLVTTMRLRKINKMQK